MSVRPPHNYRDGLTVGDGEGNVAIPGTSYVWTRRGDGLQLAHNVGGLTDLTEGKFEDAKRHGGAGADLWHLTRQKRRRLAPYYLLSMQPKVVMGPWPEPLGYWPGDDLTWKVWELSFVTPTTPVLTDIGFPLSWSLPNTGYPPPRSMFMAEDTVWLMSDIGQLFAYDGTWVRVTIPSEYVAEYPFSSNYQISYASYNNAMYALVHGPNNQNVGASSFTRMKVYRLSIYGSPALEYDQPVPTESGDFLFFFRGHMFTSTSSTPLSTEGGILFAVTYDVPNRTLFRLYKDGVITTIYQSGVSPILPSGYFGRRDNKYYFYNPFGPGSSYRIPDIPPVPGSTLEAIYTNLTSYGPYFFSAIDVGGQSYAIGSLAANPYSKLAPAPYHYGLTSGGAGSIVGVGFLSSSNLVSSTSDYSTRVSYVYNINSNPFRTPPPYYRPTLLKMSLRSTENQNHFYIIGGSSSMVYSFYDPYLPYGLFMYDISTLTFSRILDQSFLGPGGGFAHIARGIGHENETQDVII